MCSCNDCGKKLNGNSLTVEPDGWLVTEYGNPDAIFMDKKAAERYIDNRVGRELEPLFSADTIQETIERVEEKAKEHPEKFGGRKPYTEIFSELKEVFDA